MYWQCYCVASCNRYLMLINHPTDGANMFFVLIKDNVIFFILAKNVDISGLFAN